MTFQEIKTKYEAKELTYDEAQELIFEIDKRNVYRNVKSNGIMIDQKFKKNERKALNRLVKDGDIIKLKAVKDEYKPAIFCMFEKYDEALEKQNKISEDAKEAFRIIFVNR